MKAVPVTFSLPDYKRIKRLITESFPPGEYIPPREMVRMAEKDLLDFWSLYEEDRTFLGFMVVCTYRTMACLELFAVRPELRSRGYGTQAIGLLETLYPGMQKVVDIEKPDDTAPNRDQRKRRMDFYVRNGFVPTGHMLSFEGTDYEIFCKGGSFSMETFVNLYEKLMPPKPRPGDFVITFT